MGFSWVRWRPIESIGGTDGTKIQLGEGDIMGELTLLSNATDLWVVGAGDRTVRVPGWTSEAIILPEEDPLRRLKTFAGVAMGGEYAYEVEPPTCRKGKCGKDGKVTRVAVVGGERTRLVENLERVSGIAVDSSQLYVLSLGNIKTFALDGTPAAVFKTKWPKASSLAVDDQAFYLIVDDTIVRLERNT
jgi:hypothetical protein